MQTDLTHGAPVASARNVSKRYGATQALAAVSLDVFPGEVLGIVGHNGAGKSTLMRVLSGMERIDDGTLSICGRSDPDRHGYPGVRMSFQEGSLAAELCVFENVFLSSRQDIDAKRWRTMASRMVETRLTEIFPDHGIDPSDYVDDLTLSERQMVEIARASLSEDLALLILDEPTESLGGKDVETFYDYVRALCRSGKAIILVSHRLTEVLAVSDRIGVMKEGRIVSMHKARNESETSLLRAMGGEVLQETKRAGNAAATKEMRPIVLEVPMQTVEGAPTRITARKGEIVGLAGIAGQGQEQVLDRLWRRNRDVRIEGGLAYVPGDRQKSGILPIWSVARNLSISAMAGLSRFGVRQMAAETALVTDWVARLSVRGGAEAPITSLSGGNQQKVIVARAFCSDAETILLDDPFRGVDIHTKAELYQMIKAEAEAGRSIIWYSSENAEMQHCDRAYVLRRGLVAGELAGAEISDEHIIGLSFAEARESTT
ncbi:ATP-binding cassette domain-containing protein [Frigidibacter sp. ROC022]|uniref:ATP-binding cassette domain-containing protein n=1 Tax=Frigidibacter sp. ROC022 TaxID=2971796 RepID=UPI00215A206D|nr:sugar ABC transporter ATP-binding protein [Frigidibacter sp. ROC022]MCR8722773.1 sugar ABC transporter ATP-binding protein [Frigidibacter sp. ROC022]